jgi:hypothetical protein
MSFAESNEIPSELLPTARPFLDLQSYRRRVRYTQGSLNAQNNRCEITLPNEDCCSLNARLRFTATVSNTAGGTNCAPEFLGHSFFERVLVEIGGSKIVDLHNYNLMQGILDVATDPQESQGNRAFTSMSTTAQRSEFHRQGLTTFDYDIPLSLLEDSLLSHKRTLLPVFMLPRTTVTLYTASDEACTSASNAKATYTISNLELVMTYYTSASLKQYFSSVPYSLPFTDCEHRLISLPAGQSQFDIQVPSNFRSLRSLFAVARPSDIENSFAMSNKFITYDSLGGPNLSFNLRVNGFQLFQENINGRDLFFDQLRHVFGNGTLKSDFYKLGTEFSNHRSILAAQLNSLGGPDSDNYVSGARTNQHVSSLSIHITTDTILPHPLRLDVFLLYDKLLTINSGRLQVIQ